MNANDRAYKAQLRTQLVHLLTDCDDDTMYYKRLTWALEFISTTLSVYSDLIERGVQQRDLEEEPPIDDNVDESNYDPYMGCDFFECSSIDEEW